MARLVTALLAALLVIPGNGNADSALAQSSEELGGPAAQVNCGNFVSEDEGGLDHAQAVFLASDQPGDRDPYGLDGNIGSETGGEPNVACDGAVLNDAARAACSNFRAQSHAQALYDEAGPDTYDLDANGDGRACSPDEAPPSDLPPTSPAPREPRAPAAPPPEPRPTTGCDSTLVENGRVTICAGQYIEVQPFDFAAFAASAQDGFGHFSGSGTSGPIAIGVPSSAPASGSSGTSGTSGTTTVQQANESGNRVLSGQKAKPKKRKAKARKGKRGKERQRQRDRQRARQQQWS